MALMDLFRPKWKSSDWRVRRQAIQVVSDQTVIAEVATGNTKPDVRLAAVEMLDSQVLLARIAGTDSSYCRSSKILV